MKKKETQKKRMHVRFNKRLLARYALSFWAILILVAAMVLMLFRTILLRNLNDFNDCNQQNVLSTASESVVEELDRIAGLIEQASLHKELNPKRIERDVWDMISAQTQLRRLARSNDFIKECVLISGKYDFAISDLTSYQLPYFTQMFQNPMLSECQSYEEVYSVLQEHPVLSISSRGGQMLGLRFSYDYEGVFSRSYALVLISQEDLLERFTESFSVPEKMAGVICMGDETLSTLSEDTQLPPWEELRESEQVSLDGARYRVMTMEHPSGIGFAYLVEDNLYDALILKTTHQFLFWILVIFLVGTGFILVLAYYNYKPIMGVQSMLESYLKKKPEETQNELHFIAHGIDQLIAENIRLSNQLDVDRRHLKNFCLFKLLHSPNANMETSVRTLQEMGIRMDRELFQVISLSLTFVEDVEKFANRVEQERESQSPYYKLYYVINGSSFVLIFNFNEADRNMMQYLIENFSIFYVREIQMAMGVGTVVSGMQELQKSYTQSQMAMHYAETNEELSLSNFSEMKLNENLEKLYNSRQVDLLLSAIRKDDRRAIAAELGKIKSFIRESRMPRYAIKAMYYQIVNGILSNSSNPVLFEKGNEILMAIGDTLQKKTTMDQIYAQIEELCYQMVDQTSGVVLLDKILDYITQHYADPDFSIACMAEHFKMSHQSMSALFKREMHLTIIEYVTKYKMQAAADLLVHTDLPVSEIVRRAGYIDNSSFTRKFKSSMGMTPAEYRRNFTEQ